uniref:Uncharacterized protein n=1 Tax=Anguilla anguilla TaxID=7936 RepID=A0A0E9XBD8_ANGAN
MIKIKSVFNYHYHVQPVTQSSSVLSYQPQYLPVSNLKG